MYMTILTVYSPTDPTWSSGYLTDPAQRLSSLIAPVLTGPVLATYASVYNAAVASGDLLFRAKVINTVDKSLALTNIWATKAAYDDFYAAVDGAQFFASYATVGLDATIVGTDGLDAAAVADVISAIVAAPGKLIQDAATEFQTPGMVIGDPLR